MTPQEVDYKLIGQRIRRLRLEKNLTQAELSAIVGCSNNHLSHIEIGQCKPPLNTLLKLSYALDTGMDYFMLDTPYARRDVMIDLELAKKLRQCRPETLVAVNKVLDALLEQQESILASCSDTQ